MGQSFTYNYRESNRVADFLAAKGHLLDLVFAFICLVLLLGDILRDDLVGTSMPRPVTL